MSANALKVLRSGYQWLLDGLGLSQEPWQPNPEVQKAHLKLFGKAEVNYISNFQNTGPALRSIHTLVKLRPDVKVAPKYLHPQFEHPDRCSFPDDDHQNQPLSISLADQEPQTLLEYLNFLEHHAARLPVSPGLPGVSACDYFKLLAAASEVLARVHEPDAPFLLAAGDFSGIQQFLYTISSQGALKTLRARAFYLEFLGEHIIFETLQALRLPRINLVYGGGGGFLILAANTPGGAAERDLAAVQEKFNRFLFREFGGKLYLAAAAQPASRLFGPDLAMAWDNVQERLEADKRRKFRFLLNDAGLWQPRLPRQLSNEEECTICRNDEVDMPPGQALPRLEKRNPQSSPACPYCHSLFQLGSKLPRLTASFIYRRSSLPTDFAIDDTPYALSEQIHNVTAEARWSVNPIQLKSKTRDSLPFFTSAYGRRIGDLPPEAKALERAEAKAQNLDLAHRKDQEVDKQIRHHLASFAGLAQAAAGAARLGLLRLDVDNLGLLFSQGLRLGLGQEVHSLCHYAALSRELSAFFQRKIDRICHGQVGLPESPLNLLGKDYSQLGRAVSVVYAGGDDLVMVGAWDEITELAYDLRRAFAAHTGHNPEIGLSGGVVVFSPGLPLYQMAGLGRQAEDRAKESGVEKAGVKYKDRFAPFYSPAVRHRRQFLQGLRDEGAILPPPEESIRETLSWQDDWLWLHKLVAAFFHEHFIGRLHPHLQLRASHSSLRQLFAILNIWQEEGALYLPKLFYALKKIEDSLRPKNMETRMQFAIIRDFLLNPQNISRLHLALTWVELLLRRKEG